MIKLYLFDVSEAEYKMMEEVLKKFPQAEVTLSSEGLNPETMKDVSDEYAGVVANPIAELDEYVYDSLGEKNIKVLAARSAGIDMYNFDKLKENNVRLTHVPSYSPESIAEFAITGALYFVRNYPLIQKNVKEGNLSNPLEMIAQRFEDLTVGIVGTGRIGSITAQKFQALGFNVMGYDLYPQATLKNVLNYVSFDELVKKSDILSLHMPATLETHHMFNAAVFEQMKDEAILVNAGRGSLVETEALLAALDSGILKGAVIDTYESEGPYIYQNNRKIEDETFKRLIHHERVLYSPHIAYYTEEAVKQMLETSIQAALDIIEWGKSDVELKI